jgi:hypothetical protein
MSVVESQTLAGAVLNQLTNVNVSDLCNIIENNNFYVAHDQYFAIAAAECAAWDGSLLNRQVERFRPATQSVNVINNALALTSRWVNMMTYSLSTSIQ